MNPRYILLPYFAFNAAIIFLVPIFLFEIRENIEFWLILAFSLAAAIHFPLRSRNMLFYYMTYFVFVILFGHFIQSGIGISYIPGLSTPTPISTRTMQIAFIHVAGILVGSIYFSKVNNRRGHVRRKETGPGAIFSMELGYVVMMVLFILYFGTDLLLGSRADVAELRGDSGILLFLRLGVVDVQDSQTG